MRSSPPYRVLVFPGGTEIGLEIQRSLADLKEVELVGAGSEDDLHGPYAYQQWLTLPSVGADDWSSQVAEALREAAVDFVMPAHDDVLVELSEHRDALPAAIIAPSALTCRVTRSKRLTYEALAGVVPVPRVLESDAIGSWPVFTKPDVSQGSRGAAVVHDDAALRLQLAAGSDLVMEYLPGHEYTVDCFSDREVGLLFARGRRRHRTRNGISMSSSVAGDQSLFADMARRIGARLAMHGPWFFQVREDRTGVPTVLEVAPRLAGTMALSRVMGVNFALLAIYEHLRQPITVLVNDFSVSIDRALTNRYRHDLEYDCVYVDLDDTLIVREKVNLRLVAFLYQCINAGVRLVLLTRHTGDLNATLSRYRLSGLWDEVIHVNRRDHEKASYMTQPGLFIDDSFAERFAASKAGMRTFDSSMLELLLDERA